MATGVLAACLDGGPSSLSFCSQKRSRVLAILLRNLSSRESDVTRSDSSYTPPIPSDYENRQREREPESREDGNVEGFEQSVKVALEQQPTSDAGLGPFAPSHCRDGDGQSVEAADADVVRPGPAGSRGQFSQSLRAESVREEPCHEEDVGRGERGPEP